MKNLLSVIAIAAALCFVSSTEAQRPGGDRGGPPGGGPPPRAFNQENFNNNQDQPQFANQAARNQNGNEDIASIEQLAHMMIANFDADESGELGQAELQRALAALRQMMRNRAAGQNQSDQQQNGFANQRNAFQGRQNFQGDQALGNRPLPPRGQAGARRGR